MEFPCAIFFYQNKFPFYYLVKAKCKMEGKERIKEYLIKKSTISVVGFVLSIAIIFLSLSQYNNGFMTVIPSYKSNIKLMEWDDYLQCPSNKKIFIFGDSTGRLTYKAMVNVLGCTPSVTQEYISFNKTHSHYAKFLFISCKLWIFENSLSVMTGETVSSNQKIMTGLLGLVGFFWNFCNA